MVQLGDMYEWKGEVWSWKNEDRIVYVIAEVISSGVFKLMSVCGDNASFMETIDRLQNENIYEKLA